MGPSLSIFTFGSCRGVPGTTALGLRGTGGVDSDLNPVSDLLGAGPRRLLMRPSIHFMSFVNKVVGEFTFNSYSASFLSAECQVARY